MILANHDALTVWLAERLRVLPLISGNDVRVDVLGALDKDSLADFFDYDVSVGLYVHGGEYEQQGMALSEKVALAVVIGARNVAGNTASLGTDDDPGAWHYLESIRLAITDMDTNGTNMQGIRCLGWKNLLVRADMAIVGLDVEVTLVRAVSEHDLLGVYGAGFLPGREGG